MHADTHTHICTRTCARQHPTCYPHLLTYAVPFNFSAGGVLCSTRAVATRAVDRRGYIFRTLNRIVQSLLVRVKKESDIHGTTHFQKTTTAEGPDYIHVCGKQAFLVYRVYNQ